MNRLRAKSLCLFLTLVGAGAVCAQPMEEEEELALSYGDKEFVSIATGARQPLARAPAVATVITAEDIAATGATNLDEILESVPGVHVGRNAINYNPVYTFRGIYGQHNQQVLMLQNGIPMTMAFEGDRGIVWGGLPLENVARIEIIRGPGSALYGADAFAGVINIITKTAADINGTRFGVRAGSFNTWDGWVLHGGNLGPIKIAAYVRTGSTNGFKETLPADSQTTYDRLFHTSASLAPGPVNTMRDSVDGSLDLTYGQWQLRFGLKKRDNVGTYTGLSGALDPIGRTRSERCNADLTWSEPAVTDHLAVMVQASYLYYEEIARLQLLPPGASLGAGTFTEGMIGNPDKWERHGSLSAAATWTGFADHRLRFGIGHQIQDLFRVDESNNFIFVAAGPFSTPAPNGLVAEVSADSRFLRPHKRTLDYAYIQDEWSLARDWTLTAGLRRDIYSDFGGTTNPRLALAWEAAQNVTAKLMLGRAFRAPSFNEAYSINNPIAQGNPGLNPETINTVETAIAWQPRGDTQVNLSLFRYDWRDIIAFVPDAPDSNRSTARNTGRQTGQGFELEAAWEVTRSLKLSGYYALQHSVDKATGQDPGYAPRQHVYARGDWRFASNWMGSAQLNWVMDRKRAANDSLPPVPDYKTVDLTLRNVGNKNGWEFATSVRNLFNARAYEPAFVGSAIPSDLPLPRRSFYLQAVYGL